MTRPPPAEPPLDEETVRQLVAHAAAWTGFRPDAVRPEAIRNAARQKLHEGLSASELLALAARGEPRLVDLFQAVVSVGETYFFRQPEHFRIVAEELVSPMVARGAKKVRAWSAGCATGEEAWSIAACLLGACAGRAAVDVLGTDLLGRNVEIARAGRYGRWSVRDAGPLLYPVLDGGGDQREVLPPLRTVARFQVHNLLQPLEGGPFDLIFCRNVLVYFSAASAARVVQNLCDRLAPDGLIAFGTLDVDAVPPGLARLGPYECNVFRKPGPHSAVTVKAKPVRAPAAVPRPVAPSAAPAAAPARTLPPAPEPVAIHLRALAAIERSDRGSAQTLLEQLERLCPDYLPGLLESALSHAREGKRERAGELMRELLRRTRALDPEQLLPGPEALPVAYYRASAEAFLGRQEVRR